MSAADMRTAGRYLAAWVVIVFFVVLLTFIFTFLGTITCAVLAGMMLGAFKGGKWFPVLVSLVFPGVVFGMVRSARVELTQQQVILLAVLCFGAFWLTYMVSAVMFFCEQRERKPPKPSVRAAGQEALVPEGQAAATDCTAPARLVGSAVPTTESWLEPLQGNWVWESSGVGEPRCKKVIEIKEAKLELKSIDASGQTTLLGRGNVTLQSLGPSQTPVVP